MQLFLQSSIVDKGTRPTDYRADVVSGSIFAEAVAAFIIITTAITLFPHGFAGQGINSADDAARALVALAGIQASQLFAVGLLGASLLAAAVLPLSTAFVVCEAFGLERSVQGGFRRAPSFYVLFLGVLALRAGVMLIPSVPIAGVAIGTQTLDGILLPVLLVFIIILANDSRLLRLWQNGRLYNILAVVLSLLTSLLLAVTLIPGLSG